MSPRSSAREISAITNSTSSAELVAREPDLLIDRLGELSAGNRMAGHDALPAFSAG